MSGRQHKQARKAARIEARRLLADAKTSLMQSLAHASLWERMKFAWKVIFR